MLSFEAPFSTHDRTSRLNPCSPSFPRPSASSAALAVSLATPPGPAAPRPRPIAAAPAAAPGCSCASAHQSPIAVPAASCAFAAAPLRSAAASNQANGDRKSPRVAAPRGPRPRSSRGSRATRRPGCRTRACGCALHGVEHLVQRGLGELLAAGLPLGRADGAPGQVHTACVEVVLRGGDVRALERRARCLLDRSRAVGLRLLEQCDLGIDPTDELVVLVLRDDVLVPGHHRVLRCRVGAGGAVRVPRPVDLRSGARGVRRRCLRDAALDPGPERRSLDAQVVELPLRPRGVRGVRVERLGHRARRASDGVRVRDDGSIRPSTCPDSGAS